MSDGLQLQGVSLRYQTRSKEVLALENVNICVNPHEFVVVLGPSGCGKSSLIKLVSGLLPPTLGAVTFNSKQITGPSKYAGVVFQKPNLWPWKTVLANVLLPA